MSRTRPVAARATAAVLVFCVVASAGPPPIAPQPVPRGERYTSARSRWVAPFVQVTETRFDEGSPVSRAFVRRYSPGGDILSENEIGQGSFVGYFRTPRADGNTTVHSLYGDWKIEYPGTQNCVASGDGRVLARFLGEDRGPASGVILYVDGRPAQEFRSADRSVHGISMAFDGSMALVIADEGGRHRGIVTGPDGEIRFRFDPPDSARVRVSPRGDGVVVSSSPDRLQWMRASGKSKEIRFPRELQRGKGLPLWIDSHRVLLGGFGTDFHALLDLERGGILWRVGVPAGVPRAPGYTEVIALGDYLIQSGLEPLPESSRCEVVRVLYAVALATGKRVARWRSTPYPLDDWADVGRLMRRDGRVYLVTDEAFSEVRVEDIEQAGVGCCPWEALPEGFVLPALEP